MLIAIAIAEEIQGLQILHFCCIYVNMTPNSIQSSLGLLSKVTTTYPPGA